MSLKQLLLADLQRQYHYSGIGDVKPNTWGIFKKALNPRFAPVLLWRVVSHFHHLHITPLAKIASLLNFLIFSILKRTSRS